MSTQDKSANLLRVANDYHEQLERAHKAGDKDLIARIEANLDELLSVAADFSALYKGGAK